MLEMFERVLQAEQEAKNQSESIREKARAIRLEADRQTDDILVKAREEASFRITASLEKAREKARHKFDEVSDNSARESREWIASRQDEMEELAEQIVNMIMVVDLEGD